MLSSAAQCLHNKNICNLRAPVLVFRFVYVPSRQAKTQANRITHFEVCFSFIYRTYYEPRGLGLHSNKQHLYVYFAYKLCCHSHLFIGSTI